MGSNFTAADCLPTKITRFDAPFQIRGSAVIPLDWNEDLVHFATAGFLCLLQPS